MAHRRPWYKRNASDFLMGTAGMDLETRGAYSILIDLLNDRDRPIPDEPRFIAGFLNVSVRRWNSIRTTLLDLGKIFIDEDQNISNARFERERRERNEESEKLAERGRLGGLASAEKRQGELAISGLSPVLEAEESKINPAKVKDKSGESEPAAPENNDLAKAGAQASRARKTSDSRLQRRIRDSTSTSESRDSAAVDDVSFAKGKTVELDDLPEWASRLARIAGMNPDRSQTEHCLGVLKKWHRDKLTDGEAIVAAIVDSIDPQDDEGTNSLMRFDAKVRAYHRKAKAAAKSNGAKPPPIPDPVLRFDDENPTFETLRRTLLIKLGPAGYALDLMTPNIRFKVEGRRLDILGNGIWPQRLSDGDTGALIRRWAKEQGFTSVYP